MKPSILASAILFVCAAGNALADCTSNPPIAGANLTNLLNSSLVCGRPGASYPGNAADRWQEEHLASLQLWDYKLGPNNPVDPRAQVGTWSVSGNLVTHSYTGGATFSWQVRLISGNSYSFCSGGAEHVRAFIIPNGGSGCASFPP